MSGRMIACPKVYHGSLASIGATALQLIATSVPVRRGVWVKAVAANSTNLIYVGNSNVTAGVAAPTTDGYQLAANAEAFFAVDDVSKLYCIGSTTGLAVTWHAE